MNVDVGVNVNVGVEKSGVLVNVFVGVAVLVFVVVISGVLVGTLGTHITRPTLILVDDPMQFADCNCVTVVLYNNEMRNKLSPALTVYAFIHPNGGPQGMTVTVGTAGTYRIEPDVGAALFKQFFSFKTSAVIL
jgi:hypothetical protein